MQDDPKDDKQQNALTEEERKQFLGAGDVGEIDVSETDPDVEINPKEPTTGPLVDKHQTK